MLPSFVRRALERCSRRLGRWFGPDTGFGVVLIGDETMMGLRQRFFGIRRPTDVLAFPSEEGNGSLGEIFIDWHEVCRRVGLGAGSIDEAGNLLVHGFVHLTGHDHHHRQAARRMLHQELRICRSINLKMLSRPYP